MARKAKFTDDRRRDAMRMRFLRKRKLKWSQAKIARMLGYSTQTVTAWEKGKNRIPAVILKYLELVTIREKSRGKA